MIDDPVYRLSHSGNQERILKTGWNSEEFRKGHAQSGTLPEEAFTQSNKLELHEVFLDSARS